MIDQIDRRLEEWVSSIVEGVEVSLAPPSDAQTGHGINLYLLELVHLPPARSAHRPPLQLSLHYLVTTRAEQAEKAHRLLGELVFAAMEHPEFEVQLEPVPIAVWTAFGIVPRPSFVLRVPLRQERPEKVAPMVRRPPVVHTAPMAVLCGLVFGPGDTPITGAQVELPALQLSTRTDTNGRFHFPAVPTQPRVKLVRVKAKGREVTVTPEPEAEPGEPLVIRLALGSSGETEG